MKLTNPYIALLFTVLTFVVQLSTRAQGTSPAPYCFGNYTSGNCNQGGPSNNPGNGINDFINSFNTIGGSVNIANNNSGCNNGPNNYMNYCANYLSVLPSQTITCNIQSGITFAQGFAIFIDWNQDNTFNMPSEQVAATSNVPAAATWTTMTFVIPPSQPNGIYRMRVRCAFATPGTGITPCGQFTFGETEDYTIYVGGVPSNGGVPDGTLTVNTPVCVGQSLNFTLTTSYTAPLSYTWTGPNNFNSNVQNPSIFNSTVATSGIYSVTISNTVCPITRTVSALVVPYPVFTPISNPDTICQGGMFVAGIISSMNPASNLYSCNWSSAAPGLIFNPNPTLGNPPVFNTNIMPALLPANITQTTYVYNVKITPTVNPACAVTQTIGVTINNPPTPTLTMPAPLCDIFIPVQLSGTPAGGIWSGNPAVFPNGTFDPTLAAIGTNTVAYTVAIGICMVTNTASLSVSKFISSALSSSIATRCVQDPVFNLMNVVQNTVTGYWHGPQVNNNFFNAAGLATGNYTLHYHTNSTPIPNVCRDSTDLVVPVFSPATPSISNIIPLCNTAGTIMVAATPTGGIWAGNPGISSAGVRTPSLNLIGTNTVMYTAGLGTCVASNSSTFIVSEFRTAALTGIIPQLCENANPVNLKSIVQNTNGTWVAEPTMQALNFANNIFTPVNLSGPYNFTYTNPSSPNPTLCADNRTLSISVLFPVAPTIFQAGPFCSVGGVVQLAVTPSIGSWIPTPYLTSAGKFNPGLAAIGNNPVQYVVGTSTCNAQSIAFINVESFVSAAITGKIDDQCNTNLAISLDPFTQNSTGYWSGPGIGGNTFNPGITGSGNFVLNYNTSSIPSGLCPDQATVAVNVYSLASPVISSAGPFCSKSLPFQLQVSPVGGLFGGNTPGTINSDGVFNPATSLIGDNYINYTISVGPCLAYTQAKIVVEEFITAALAENAATIYCKNNLPFSLMSLVQNTTGKWAGDASPALNGSMFNPSLANKTNQFVYSTTSSPLGKCSDSNTITIQVKDVPPITGRRSAAKDCAPFTVDFNTADANSGKATWNITNGVVLQGLTSSYTFEHPGTYSVVLSYTEDDVNGCFAQFTFPTPIEVLESPKADFIVPSNEITISEPEVTLTNSSGVLTSNKYKWTVEGVENVPTDQLHLRVKFPHAGNFKVNLAAVNFEGCKSEVSKVIEVKNDFYIHIPNSFTPNFDGLNDSFIPVFSPYGLDAKSFEMEIYDRWGHQVYRGKDYIKGWNGTIKGDDVAKEDTYIYKIKYKDLEGRLYNKTGYLTLLRN